MCQGGGGSEKGEGVTGERVGHHYILLKRSKCNSAGGQNFESASARVLPRCVPGAVRKCLCVRVKGGGGSGGGGGGRESFFF